MKKMQFPIFAALLVLFTMVLSAPGQVRRPAKRPLKQVKQVKQAVKMTAPATGLLYKISGNGLKKPSYIFGTIHVICQKDMFPMTLLNSHLMASERVVLEVDMDDPAEMRAAALATFMPEGKTLADFLTQEEYDKVEAYLKKTNGMTLKYLRNIKPMVLQMALVGAPKTIGCTAPVSYELLFLKIATANKKPVEGLETAVEQLTVFDEIPLEKQARELYEATQDPERGVDKFASLLSAYKMQDIDKLYDEVSRQQSDQKEFQADLLDKRNILWIPKIEKAMQEKGCFIAVGGGHLGGDNGVIKLLRAKGYILQPIKL
ncbi:MAG TPA: TraB/GumN family protein [Pyrinomonadaceae bacterium]|jgi:uncharacterized protein YbaP (TraB family)|nr:TraB/GumN family protein [Pyrinomonadaceae bacterium]